MKSNMTKFEAYGKEITSKTKKQPNYEPNNTNLFFEKFSFLLVIIFIVIGIFLSIKGGNDKVVSIYSDANNEKLEQATDAAKAYWRFAPLYRDDIIDELLYEGFTYDEAVYGLEENDY